MKAQETMNYEVYNKKPSRVGSYSEQGQATRAMRNSPDAACVAKAGKVLSYKSGLTAKEQGRIRDAIEELYEEEESKQEWEQRAVPATVMDGDHHDDATTPATTAEVVASPTITPASTTTPPTTSPAPHLVEQSVPLRADGLCNNPNRPCSRQALPIRPKMRPEHHGLCKYCRDTTYVRSRNGRRINTVKLETLSKTRDLAKQISDLLVSTQVPEITPEMKEKLDLADFIGLDILRGIAARIRR